MSKKPIHLYTDGSAFNGSGRYGIGGFVLSRKGKTKNEFFERLSINGADSMIAEIHAAAKGLELIKVYREALMKEQLKTAKKKAPQKAKKLKRSSEKRPADIEERIKSFSESRVVIHSDCSALCTAIVDGSIDKRIKAAKNRPPLRDAWKALDSAIQKHTEVSAHFQSVAFEAAIDDPMLHAHQLAQAGAAMAFHKEAFKNPKDADKSQKGRKGKTRRPRNKRVEVYDDEDVRSQNPGFFEDLAK